MDDVHPRARIAAPHMILRRGCRVGDEGVGGPRGRAARLPHHARERILLRSIGIGVAESPGDARARRGDRSTVATTLPRSKYPWMTSGRCTRTTRAARQKNLTVS